MPKLILPAIRNEALLYVGVACIIALFVSLVLWLIVGPKAGYSGLLGGLVWGIPNGYAAWRLFSNMSARAVKQIVRNFYWAEAAKLFLSALLFVLTIKFVPLNLGSFFASYLVAQFGFWLMPCFVAMKK